MAKLKVKRECYGKGHTWYNVMLGSDVIDRFKSKAVAEHVCKGLNKHAALGLV